MIFIGALYLLHLDDYSALLLALFYILSTAAVVFERMVLRWVDRARRRKGLGLRHISCGGRRQIRHSICVRWSITYYGFVVDGYLAKVEEPGLGVKFLGGYDNPGRQAGRNRRG